MGAIIGGVLGLGGALIGSSSASDAANAQTNAANTAAQTQLAMFNQTQANEQPFLQGGNNALAALMQGLGLGPQGGGTTGVGGGQTINIPGYGPITIPNTFAGGYGGTTQSFGASTNGPLQTGELLAPFTADKFQASPGYQYQLQQGQQAIDNSAAAKGGLVSGNALRALQQNAMGLANQDFYNAENVYQGNQLQKFNMLQTLAGSGQNAAANLGALGSQVAGNIGNLQLAQGGIAANNAAQQNQIFQNLINNQSFLGGINSLFGGGNSGFPSNLGSAFSTDYSQALTFG